MLDTDVIFSNYAHGASYCTATYVLCLCHSCRIDHHDHDAVAHHHAASDRLVSWSTKFPTPKVHILYFVPPPDFSHATPMVLVIVLLSYVLLSRKWKNSIIASTFTARAWDYPLAQSVERWTPLLEVSGSNLGRVRYIMLVSQLSHRPPRPRRRCPPPRRV